MTAADMAFPMNKSLMTFTCMLFLSIVVYLFVVRLWLVEIPRVGEEKKADLSFYNSECGEHRMNQTSYRLSLKGSTCERWRLCMNCMSPHDCHPKMVLKRVTTCWAVAHLVTKILAEGHDLWGRFFDF